MRREGVAERVARRALRDPRRQRRRADRLLHDRLMQVMAPALLGLAVDVGARCGEDPLPGPLSAGAWQLLPEPGGRLDEAGSGGEVHIGAVLYEPACGLRRRIDLHARLLFGCRAHAGPLSART